MRALNMLGELEKNLFESVLERNGSRIAALTAQLPLALDGVGLPLQTVDAWRVHAQTGYSGVCDVVFTRWTCMGSGAWLSVWSRCH